MEKLTKEGFLDALNQVTWYNGLAEIVASWAQLPVDPVYRSIVVPAICWKNEQLQLIWMIAVSLFGNYGTSPRGGWIESENAEEFKKFCLEITRFYREEAEFLESIQSESL